MGLSDLLIVGLAAHRLWVLWLSQVIFRPVREGLMRLHPRIAYFVNCGVCTSVWIGAGVAVVWVHGGPAKWLVWALTVSEAVGILESVMRVVTRERV